MFKNRVISKKEIYSLEGLYLIGETARINSPIKDLASAMELRRRAGLFKEFDIAKSRKLIDFLKEGTTPKNREYYGMLFNQFKDPENFKLPFDNIALTFSSPFDIFATLAIHKITLSKYNGKVAAVISFIQNKKIENYIPLMLPDLVGTVNDIINGKLKNIPTLSNTIEVTSPVTYFTVLTALTIISNICSLYKNQTEKVGGAKNPLTIEQYNPKWSDSIVVLHLDKLNKITDSFYVPRNKFTQTCEYDVRGHWRHLKSGKKVWVSSYTRGKGKPRKETTYVVK